MDTEANCPAAIPAEPVQKGLKTLGDPPCPNPSRLEEHPVRKLQERAKRAGLALSSLEFARLLDAEIDSLRSEFRVPKMQDLPDVDLSRVNAEEDCIYLCGNSLGLMPTGTRDKLERELDKWAKHGVHGHRSGVMPWAFCDECVEESLARLVGALREEVTIMNGLTINLHLQLISFYRPTPKRHKILLEAHAFPSDQYAVESQIRLKGYDPDKSMILLEPRKGEETLRLEDILEVIETQGDSIAVLMMPGVQYYTGQLLDIKTITQAGHNKGCVVGWDMAHAAGNAELFLHDWDVDFACWCTYKYMNSGAGCLAGFFIHQRLFEEAKSFPRLLGWWSHKIETRFDMDNQLQLEDGARGFRVSNPPVMLTACIEASMDVFNKTSMSKLRSKSKLLTGYLECLLNEHFPYLGEASGKPYIRVITPGDPDQRGAQLSVMFSVPISKVHTELKQRGVVCDYRSPNVLRLAPAPLYNTFEDVYRFIKILDVAILPAIES